MSAMPRRPRIGSLPGRHASGRRVRRPRTGRKRLAEHPEIAVRVAGVAAVLRDDLEDAHGRCDVVQMRGVASARVGFDLVTYALQSRERREPSDALLVVLEQHMRDPMICGAERFLWIARGTRCDG